MDFTAQALVRAAGLYVSEKGMSFSMLRRQLQDLRGYSITLTVPGKNVVRRASMVNGGDLVRVMLAEGGLECRVEKSDEKMAVLDDSDEMMDRG